jgi:hypothetical protein
VPEISQEVLSKLVAGYRPEAVDRGTTWIPSPRNPSKLIQHRWDEDKEEWVSMGFARFVRSKSFEEQLLKGQD